MKKLRYTAISTFLTLLVQGCSQTPYGEDIVFSHSIPKATVIKQCDCEKNQQIMQPMQQNMGEIRDVSITIYYGTDLYSFDATAVESLENLVSFIGDNQVVSLTIVGHTDSRASYAYNETLSQRRANAVVDYLHGRGIHSNDFSASWQGEKAPVADNTTADGMALNRRSVVTAKVLVKQS